MHMSIPKWFQIQDRHRLLLFAAAFLIVLCAFVASTKTKPEHFYQAPLSMKMHDVKNYLYNMNGLANFYSSGDKATTRFVADMTSGENMMQKTNQVMSFMYTDLDNYCAETIGKGDYNEDTSRCQNIFIDFLTCPDKSVSYNKAVSTNTLVGPSNNKCDIRIFNNIYKFMKRAVVLNITSIVQDNNANINPMITVDPTNFKKFKVTVKGDLTQFVMLRPLLISFGPYGLFVIRHNENDDNVFRKYPQQPNGTKPEDYSNTLYLSQVETFGYETYKMYPNNNPTGIIDLYGSGSTVSSTTLSNYPATVYYLSYHQSLNVYSSITYLTQVSLPILNTFTVVLSKDFLEQKQGDAQTISIGPLQFQPPQNNTSNYVSGISFLADKNSKASESIFLINMTFVPSGTTNTFRPHEDFLTKLAAYRNAATQVPHKYHIVVTASTDVLIVVAFLQDQGSSYTNDNMYMMRYPILNGNVLAYDGDALLSTIKSGSATIFRDLLITEMKKYNSFVTMSSIPNFEYVAKSLGYAI